MGLQRIMSRKLVSISRIKYCWVWSELCSVPLSSLCQGRYPRACSRIICPGFLILSDPMSVWISRSDSKKNTGFFHDPNQKCITFSTQIDPGTHMDNHILLAFLLNFPISWSGLCISSTLQNISVTLWGLWPPRYENGEPVCELLEMCVVDSISVCKRVIKERQYTPHQTLVSAKESVPRFASRWHRRFKTVWFSSSNKGSKMSLLMLALSGVVFVLRNLTQRSPSCPANDLTILCRRDSEVRDQSQSVSNGSG